jgi:hypothetical protein
MSLKRITKENPVGAISHLYAEKQEKMLAFTEPSFCFL